MKKSLLAAALLCACGLALAKIPAPVLDDAAKAKAAEAAAKTAWQGKVDAYLLCKAQDRVVAAYRKTHGATSAIAPTVASAPVTTASAAAQGGGTPVPNVGGSPPITPCADPGPFAYAPPSEKPLETSGAHSPAPTAASPPSVKAPSAEMAPKK